MMKVFIQLKDGRLVGQGSTRGTISDVEIEVDDDHEVLKNPFIYKYENGQLIKDEAYLQQLIMEEEERKNKPTLEQEISQLKKQNADLAFELMMKGVL